MEESREQGARRGCLKAPRPTPPDAQLFLDDSGAPVDVIYPHHTLSPWSVPFQKPASIPGCGISSYVSVVGSCFLFLSLLQVIALT